EPLPQGYQTFTLTLKGLKGGHSGGDVHLGLGNANKLLARFLAGHAEDLSLKLLEFRGGTVRNAIPREAHAIISVPTEKVAELTALRERYEGILKNELAVIEPNLVLLLDETQSDLKALSDDCQKRFTFFLNAAPNGVIRMSDVAVGVVETSLNEGVVRMTEDQAEVIFLVRSLIDSGKNYVVNMLTSISKLAQAQYRAEGSYPG
ncbi:peptidase dimerization domain-containing protein, partial [Providencia vermicola]